MMKSVPEFVSWEPNHVDVQPDTDRRTLHNNNQASNILFKDSILATATLNLNGVVFINITMLVLIVVTEKIK